MDRFKAKSKSENLDVIITQTQKKGYLRTSKLGLQHFAQKKGETPDDWKPESPHHLLAKNEILKACKKAGWEAISEFQENDWIADVIAVNGKNRIAFEVQWSNQSYERTIERQEEYSNDNVRACGFFKKLPKEMKENCGDNLLSNKELPAFQIFETGDKEICVSFYDKKYSIGDFVTSLLTRKIKFCKNLTSKPKQQITVS